MKFIVRHNLVLFTVLTVLVTIFTAINFQEFSFARKAVNLFLIILTLHEWEETKYPGGFYEMMNNKMGFEKEKTNLHLAHTIVVIYILLVTLIPYIFDGVVWLALIPAFLGIFEGFIHTAGIFIHHTKKPYTPGMATGWIYAAAAIYVMIKLSHMFVWWNYLAGVAIMAVGFIIMVRCQALARIS